MKHLAAIIIGIVLIVAGLFAFYHGAVGKYSPALIAGSSTIVAGVMLLIPAEAKAAGLSILELGQKGLAAWKGAPNAPG